MPDVTHELAAQTLLPDSPVGDAAIARAVLAVTRATRESTKCLDDIGDTLAEVLIYLRSRDNRASVSLVRVTDDVWLNPACVVSVSEDSDGHATVQLAGAAAITFATLTAQDVVDTLLELVYA